MKKASLGLTSVIKLTALEMEALEVIETIQDFLASKNVSRPEYMIMMGRLRDLRVKLENKKYGCPSGRHAEACSCMEPEKFY